MKAFANPINLSNSAKGIMVSTLASYEGNVYVAWENRDNPPNQISFAASNNFGATFSGPLLLSDGQSTSSLPRVAAWGNEVYVAWLDTAKNDYYVRLIVSHDSGSTFDAPLTVRHSNNALDLPKVAAFRKGVYVVYEEESKKNNMGDIFFSASYDRGETLSQPTDLSQASTDTENPSIATDGRQVYVVWEDLSQAGWDVSFTASHSFGKKFDLPVNVSNNPWGGSPAPDVAMSGANAFVVWKAPAKGITDVFFVASHDRGKNFDPPIDMSKNPKQVSSYDPQVAAFRNFVYVKWATDFPNPTDVFFDLSRDSGKPNSFAMPTNVTQNNANAFARYSAMGTNENTVDLVWALEGAGLPEIDFTTSQNYGAAFDKVISVSNKKPGAIHPLVAAFRSYAYAIWEDFSSGTTDVFFSAGK